MEDNVISNGFSTEFSEAQKTAAHRIITSARRELAREYPYLEQAVFYHKLKATSKTDFMGSDYTTLYYNPAAVIECFRKKRRMIKHTLLHMALHCMCHHLSMEFSDPELFEAAADASVNAMLESIINTNKSFRKFAADCGGISAPHIYNAAKENRKLRNRLKALYESSRADDHRMWRQKDEEEQGGAADPRSGGKGAQHAAVVQGTAASLSKGTGNTNTPSAVMVHANGQASAYADWGQIMTSSEHQSGKDFGSSSGDLFADVTPPDRFSKMDYISYIRKFIQDEIIREDPDTIDLMMYTASLDIYGDMPIVEFCETQENLDPSDIIIAIDMSGSCSGDIAVNFLRQVYTLFERFNIQGRVNIRVVTFDTEILDQTVIRSRSDADSFIKNYEGKGFGGTDFNCVFDYADQYAKESGGRKLKGLFFFSDAEGSFPSEKPGYPTVFFVPSDPNMNFQTDYYPKPEWADYVRYDDN